MTKYMIYAEDENDPGKQIQIKKTKREYEALDFIGDFKNLQRYGCMAAIKTSDDGGRFRWNAETSIWEPVE